MFYEFDNEAKKNNRTVRQHDAVMGTFDLSTRKLELSIALTPSIVNRNQRFLTSRRKMLCQESQIPFQVPRPGVGCSVPWVDKGYPCLRPIQRHREMDG